MHDTPVSLVGLCCSQWRLVQQQLNQSRPSTRAPLLQRLDAQRGPMHVVSSSGVGHIWPVVPVQHANEFVAGVGQGKPHWRLGRRLQKQLVLCHVVVQ